MSSVIEPQPDPPAADELVAYLDGELPPQDCRRVESRLAADDAYRQQLHELDRAWEALDALPTPTVDDGFARTTIELACVAAQADLTEHTAVAKAVKRDRMRRWIAAGVATLVVGFFAGRSLIPNRNQELVNDLPAIHQLSVLPYVENVEFLRQLPAAIPLEQLIKDEPAFASKVKELESVNSPWLDTRRNWIVSLQPEQKAELADEARTFVRLQPSIANQERMRKTMEEIRNDPESATLQKTLIAYGQWMTRHTPGQRNQIWEELSGHSPEDQARMVAKMIRREEGQASHLSSDDAKRLHDEILTLAADKKDSLSQQMIHNQRGDRLRKLEQNPVALALVILYRELLQENKFEPTANQLVAKLSSDARTHWDSLDRGQARRRQFGVWVRDAIRPKLDPEELERFFTSDELKDDDRQKLLNKTRSEMEAELKQRYLSTGVGFDVGLLLREFGESGRMPPIGPGIGGPQWRPDGRGPDGMKHSEPGGPSGMRPRQRFGTGRAPGPDGGPDRRADRPRKPGPDQPPPKEQKPEAI